MLRTAFSAFRNSRRFDVEMQSFELPGGRHQNYDWGYPPLAYHVKWRGQTALREKLDARASRISDHTEHPWYKHKRQRKVADIVVEFTNYTEESYSSVKRTIKSDFGRVRVDDPIEYEQKTPATDKPTFYWSEYHTEFHPWFKSWLFRTLTYIMQGVESNIELASEKMYFRELGQEQFHLTRYKIPGDHLMTDRQFEQNRHQFYSDVQKRSEMPPICVPRPQIDTEFEHKSKLFLELEGSDLVLTDVSPDKTHETRDIILRERKTGKLRYCTWEERDRRLQAFYPTKFRSLELPIYIQPDHSDFDGVVDNFLTNFEEKGAMQIMEAAVSYYDINSDRYCRLRAKLNDALIGRGMWDALYATRHGGQFIFHLLENGHTEAYLKHLISVRTGPARVQELRTMLILMELVQLVGPELLRLEQGQVKEYLDQIFARKHFSSSIASSLSERDEFSLLLFCLSYDERYLLNSYPDYAQHLKR